MSAGGQSVTAGAADTADSDGAAGAGSTRLLKWLEFPAQLAVLNLCWLLAALPLITSYGAGIALHASLRAWREEGETRPSVRFIAEFRARLRSSLPLAVAGLPLLAALWCAASFWLGAPGPLLAVAAVALVPLAVLVLIGHLTLFEVASHEDRADASFGSLVRAALQPAVTRPGRCLLALAACVTWAAVLWRLPGLAPVCGISAPALLLHRLFRRS
ncbi:DUF624 domain-containing protein [Streptomyces sp. NPDC051322]|uniref:DUF624 domain-containing protein n=1 Tax=Streptomyces sp. NPDC051322 TaxID=3154645 RepID=UPI00344D898A